MANGRNSISNCKSSIFRLKAIRFNVEITSKVTVIGVLAFIMKNTITFLIFLVSISFVNAQNTIYGEYGSVFRINPDSTYYKACWHCLVKDTIYGNWIEKDDTIFFSFSKDDPLAKHFINNFTGIVNEDTLILFTSEYPEKLYKTRGFFANGNCSSSGQWEYSFPDYRKVGKWVIYFENGNVKEIQTYEKGKLQGELTSFYETGFLKKIEQYKDGELNGIATEYYSTGKIKRKTNYKNGLLNGIEDYYYEHGYLAYRGYWKKNQQCGKWYLRDKDGINECYLKYKKGVLLNVEEIKKNFTWITIGPNDNISDKLIETLNKK